MRTQCWQGTSLPFEPVATQTILTERLPLSFFLAPCLCPFISKHFISGSQAGLVASPGIRGTRLLLCSVSGLWPKHTHSVTLKKGYLRRYSISINQYTNSHSPFCQLPQKLVPLLKDHGNHSEVLGASLGKTQWRVKMWMRLRTHTRKTTSF